MTNFCITCKLRPVIREEKRRGQEKVKPSHLLTLSHLLTPPSFPFPFPYCDKWSQRSAELRAIIPPGFPQERGAWRRVELGRRAGEVGARWWDGDGDEGDHWECVFDKVMLTQSFVRTGAELGGKLNYGSNERGG